MKVELKLNPDQVFACSKMLRGVVDSQLPPTGREQKLIRSMAVELNDKFNKEAQKLKKSLDLFEIKKKVKITLKYHDAWALEKLIFGAVSLIEEPYTIQQLRQLAGDINQKTQ